MIYFPIFQNYKDILWHGVFTRNGGYSKPPFESLNVGFRVGDDKRTVEKNRDIIKKASKASKLVFINQEHETNILIIDEKSADSDNLIGDAMITDNADIFLAIQIADCQAILIFDPIKKIIANIHSGWRSSIQNIIGKTIEKMQKVFGTQPSNIKAGISPSLGTCCAEFKNYKKEFPEQFFKYKKENYNFDFWEVSREQLCEAGVYQQNINTSKICTACNTKNFFSYRKEKNTGRFTAVIGLKL